MDYIIGLLFFFGICDFSRLTHYENFCVNSEHVRISELSPSPTDSSMVSLLPNLKILDH